MNVVPVVAVFRCYGMATCVATYVPYLALGQVALATIGSFLSPAGGLQRSAQTLRLLQQPTQVSAHQRLSAYSRCRENACIRIDAALHVCTLLDGTAELLKILASDVYSSLQHLLSLLARQSFGCSVGVKHLCLQKGGGLYTMASLFRSVVFPTSCYT